MSHKKRLRFSLLVALLSFCSSAESQLTWRASVTSAGQQANGNSGLGEDIAVSADGRYVAFMSRAANMNPGDTGTQTRVYRFDRMTGTSQLASVAIDGSPMIVISFGLSGDGNLVVFQGTSQVYVRNMALGQTEQVSLTHDEQQPNSTSGSGCISSDGRYVLFSSLATNLVAAPPVNGIHRQIYVRDRVAGTTILVSQNTSEEVAGDDASSSFRMRGHQAMFFSQAANLVPEDTNHNNALYMRNLDTGVLEVLLQASDNIEDTDLSDDGRFMVFRPVGGGLQLRDLVAGTTTSVDRAFNGGAANQICWFSRVSNDGRYVSFASLATNLLPPGMPHPGTQQTYVRDMLLSRTVLVSADYDGNYSDANAGDPGIATSSQFAVFKSFGSHVVLGDTNAAQDVFLRQFTFDCDTPRVTAHPTAPAVCTNQPIAMTVGAAGTGIQYQWSHDGVEISGATSATYSIANATTGDAGLYSVRVYNACGPVFSHPVQVLVLTDMNGSGGFDIADLAELLSNFGRTSGVTYADGDLNGDGAVSLPDLTALLSIFGQPCP